MTAPTSPKEPDMNYDDDESMPPPDMELRRLAIKAGLTQPTPLDTFHDMAGALGFRQAGSAEARIADLERRLGEAESDLAAARVAIGELVWGLRKAERLLSLCEFDEPVDVEDLAEVAALVARYQQN